MNLIVAVDKNWNIGNNGNLLVSIPEDMKFFRTTTSGKIVVMGRKTLESFPNQKPLKNRKNIVLTNNNEYVVDGAIIVHSVDELMEMLSVEDEEDVFVIGGSSIYKQLLPYCSIAYVTKIYEEYEADSDFPNLDMEEDWELVEDGEEKDYEGIKYRFCKYAKDLKIWSLKHQR